MRPCSCQGVRIFWIQPNRRRQLASHTHAIRARSRGVNPSIGQLTAELFRQPRHLCRCADLHVALPCPLPQFRTRRGRRGAAPVRARARPAGRRGVPMRGGTRKPRPRTVPAGIHRLEAVHVHGRRQVAKARTTLPHADHTPILIEDAPACAPAARTTTAQDGAAGWPTAPAPTH